MARITVRARGLTGSLVVDLAPGESVLLGRAPEVSKLPAGPLASASVRAARVDSPHVSGNHALVTSRPDGVFALDLGSRNGTAIKLGPNEAGSVRGARLTLELASASSEPAEAARAAPETVEGTPSEEFSVAVVRSVARWLEDAEVSARVSCARAPGERPAGESRFHLADGAELSVALAPGSTVDARWPARLEQLAAWVDEQNGLFDQELGHDEGFVLRSPRFREAHRRVYEAAQRGRRVLLLGPSGAGKERLAECYHRHSRRHDAPFKAIHCGLIDQEMIWVQLFGAARGAYTGSVRDVVGAVEAAHGGTIFLDEVAELSPRVQSALLRLLDRRGEYERLGDPRVRTADVQVVAATNADLRAAVVRGEFREDLWYRFTGSVVQVPPLRERPEDLAAFLRARPMGPGVSAHEALTPEGREVVMAHGWPGNFRELDNFIARLTPSKAGGVDARAAREALAEGTTRPMAPEAALEAPSHAGFRELVVAAASAYEEDHAGAAPGRLGDVKDFVDAYLKPLFVAHGCGLADRDELPPSVNFSALGRALDIADGTTVKKCLQRYFDRYRRPR